MIRKIVASAVLACSALLAAGCAPSTLPVSFVYAPTGEAKGGSGDLLLKSSRCAGRPGEEVRWVLGRIKDGDGQLKSEIVSSLSPEDLLLDALTRELSVAGYRVRCGTQVPAGVGKAVELTSAKVQVSETENLAKVEGSASVELSVDIWRDGKMVKRVDYRAANSNMNVVDRDQLPRQLIEQGLQQVMRQAAPEIVSVLEQR